MSSAIVEAKHIGVIEKHSGALSAEIIERARASFGRRDADHVAQNAVTRAGAMQVALNHTVARGIDHSFSIRLDDWEATNQGKSGRCWLFAILNILRPGAIKKLGVKEFELSQAHLHFWDKFERANWFLEAVIATSALPLGDRTVSFLLDRPLDDGGQWHMALNLIRRHGVVPKWAMPETESSSNTAVMNANLRSKLREAASQLRDLRTQGAPMEAARAAKEQALEVIFRMLCIHLGTPPSRFVWQWEDRDRAFHRHGEVTPQEFANFIIEPSLGESVCLVHDPRPEHPYGRTYTVEHLGNVVGGERVIYLNVELPVMKNAIRSTLEAAQPVWFGCDVAPMMARDLGIWDASTFDWNRLYGTQFTMDKATRVRLGESRMTHAMVFTGADISGEGDADRTGPVVRRWRVENSWGTEAGQKGFFTMNDSWFDEYVFEAAVHRRFIPQSLLAALDAEPIVLPPWDPMGALAHR